MSFWIPADIVFDFLFNNGYVTPFKWKNTNPQKSYYIVSFNYDINGMEGEHSFQITVENGNHYITKHALEILSLKANIRSF